jgi:hypothetical protein
MLSCNHIVDEFIVNLITVPFDVYYREGEGDILAPWD